MGMEGIADDGGRSSSPSRTSTGPTTACSTRSSTSRSGSARRSCSSASRATSCSTVARLGRRAALGHPAPARSARRGGHARAGGRAAPGRRRGGAARWSERSGGNPLFAEEMARRIAEEGDARGRRAARHRAGRAGGAARRPGAVRAAAGAAGGRGGTDLLGGLAGAAGQGGGPGAGPGAHRAPGEGHPRPGAEGRLAGERELAFKHVLIRDVAYGMLPKAVRSRKHFEVGAFIEERAGDRTDEVVALLAEHYGRAASLGPRELARGGRAGADARACRALPGGGGGRRRAPLLEPRGCCPLPARARAVGDEEDRAALVRVAEKLGDVSLRLGRVDEAISRLAGVPRLAPRPGGPRARGGPPPQDRCRAVAQGRAPRRDRALPARASTC